jgi:hypothetical protein
VYRLSLPGLSQSNPRAPEEGAHHHRQGGEPLETEHRRHRSFDEAVMSASPILQIAEA